MTVTTAAVLDGAKVTNRAWQPAGLAAFANLFEKTDVATSIATWERVALFLLVAIGAWVRFYGMGSWGLEYDEETMAMPVLHIVEHGVPAMPSGMTYVRALAQLYLMAGSVILFGESEWALRLPSALCGLALIITSFYLGRRFLSPLWNIAFVAAVTFLPALILDSQEARMYSFLLTSVNLFTLFVFRWERSNRTADLVWACVWMCIAIQFHSLAIFAAFVVFFPGLLQGDSRRILQAMAAFGVMAVAFLVIDHWVESFFPPRPEVRGIEVTAERHLFADVALDHTLMLIAGLAVAAGLVWFVVRGVTDRSTMLTVGGLLLAGFIAQSFLFYHVAFLLLGVGVLAALRASMPVKVIGMVLALAAVLTATHVTVLLQGGVPASRELLAALSGMPSPWTYLRFATYAPVAAGLLVLAGVVAAARLATGKRVSDAWLYAVLSVWLPLFLIGCFTWYPQLRYTEISLLPMLVCAFAVASGLLVSFTSRRAAAIAVAVVLCVLVVDPRATAAVINAGYSMHPDHKGAAEYVRSVRQPSDIILAEDVLQHTYYLGKVDYWLIGAPTARLFSEVVDGREVDLYTHTPVMTSAEQVHALMARKDRGNIYIIGSAEQQSDGRRHVRGESLSKLLSSAQFEVVYRGRDRLTNVWRIPPLPAETSEANTASQSRAIAAPANSPSAEPQ